MIIWSGWGIMVAVIVVMSSLIVSVISTAVTGNGQFYEQSLWAPALSMAVAGIGCWFFGKFVNKPGGRIMIDKETGEEVLLRNSAHRFFFIKIEYWAPILFVVAVGFLFTN